MNEETQTIHRNYYILVGTGAVKLSPAKTHVVIVNIREADQFSSFESADMIAKMFPAIRAGWYHIVCDAFPSGTVRIA